MTQDEIRQRIKTLVLQVSDLKVEDIADDSNFVDDLGLDSLTLLEIGMAIDYDFKLNVPDEELEDLLTMQDAVDMVVRKLEEASVAANE